MEKPASSPKRTLLAQNAVDTADMVMLAFAGRLLGDDPKMRLGITAFGGVSTEGGKRARQALTLVRSDRQDGVMIGWMDVASRQAALRPFTNAKCLYTARFQTPAPFRQAEYEAFAAALKGTLTQHGFAVAEEVADVPAAALMAERSSGTPPWLPLAVAVAVLAAGIAAVAAG